MPTSTCISADDQRILYLNTAYGVQSGGRELEQQSEYPQ
jgi:hypothetical protein